MHAREFFESLWSEPAAAEQEQPSLCRFAAAFQPWAETLVGVALKQPTLVGINQCKLLLLGKYFEWRSVVPRVHRDKMSTIGHICIWHIFEAAYSRLRETELMLSPPQLFVSLPALPSSSSEPSPQQIAGIFIGEEE